ncbi:MAG TPA: type II toxin-antitoxin system HicB family antitoxin [Dehalococcoidia bacterium]|nr:type II toxin-antitoxin system HicB family antitoxin [Dehalococcoidia bacterium]
MTQREYVIIIHPEETGGYWTGVPALPGCGSQGETVEEAVAMTRDAIQGYLASLKKQGEPIPDERDIVLKVSVAA